MILYSDYKGWQSEYIKEIYSDYKGWQSEYIKKYIFRL